MSLDLKHFSFLRTLETTKARELQRIFADGAECLTKQLLTLDVPPSALQIPVPSLSWLCVLRPEVPAPLPSEPVGGAGKSQEGRRREVWGSSVLLHPLSGWYESGRCSLQGPCPCPHLGKSIHPLPFL